MFAGGRGSSTGGLARACRKTALRRGGGTREGRHVLCRSGAWQRKPSTDFGPGRVEGAGIEVAGPASRLEPDRGHASAWRWQGARRSVTRRTEPRGGRRATGFGPGRAGHRVVEVLGRRGLGSSASGASAPRAGGKRPGQPRGVFAAAPRGATGASPGRTERGHGATGSGQREMRHVTFGWRTGSSEVGGRP
jgi:hypothetical protein